MHRYILVFAKNPTVYQDWLTQLKAKYPGAHWDNSEAGVLEDVKCYFRFCKDERLLRTYGNKTAVVVVHPTYSEHPNHRAILKTMKGKRFQAIELNNSVDTGIFDSSLTA